MQYNCVHLNTPVCLLTFRLYTNSAAVVKLLMYQHLQKLGAKKHGQQNDVLLFRKQQMSGLFKKYVVLLAFKRTLSKKFAFLYVHCVLMMMFAGH